MITGVKNYKGEFICKNCNESFLVTKPRYSHPNFCCRACTHKYHGPIKLNKVTISCTQCDKDVTIHPYRLKKSKTHFCDTKCKALFFTDNEDFIKKIKIGCLDRPPISAHARMKISLNSNPWNKGK